MSYAHLAACVADLETQGELRRVDAEIDPYLELAAAQRRLYQKGSPAVLFTRVKGTAFPCLANLYGTQKRVHYLFRDTLAAVEGLFALAADPTSVLRKPWTALKAAGSLTHAWPREVGDAPILAGETRLSALPQLKSWPLDGGAYITLPQVYSEHVEKPGWMRSNLGMYRVQISSHVHATDAEAGLHYQIHRGIGIHHEAALRRGEALRVSIFVGGPPAHALAAVMPLPEGMPEIAFAGLLAGRRFRYARRDGHLLSADADFCVTGTLDPARALPEGPFGDHLGYYSLAHDFPVLRVEKVYHRRGAIWPFTVVGRPPQEDSHFSELIHDLTKRNISMVLPGVRAVHAVEASGVHPLLLALGSERYTPYSERRPRELLTQAQAILGFGQLSLAKFLWLAAWEDEPNLNIRDVGAFLRHVLQRLRLDEDLHFITRTTMDTLDYSGHGLHQGSKVLVVAAGKPVRDLAAELPEGMAEALPREFTRCKMLMPGLVMVQAPAYENASAGISSRRRLIQALQHWAHPQGSTTGEPFSSRDEAHAFSKAATSSKQSALSGLPLWVLVDDLEFAIAHLDNAWWVAFTRCDPAPDSDGVFAFQEAKHWGCFGPWILDARRKPHHAPALEEDAETERRLDAMAAPGQPLHGLI